MCSSYTCHTMSNGCCFRWANSGNQIQNGLRRHPSKWFLSCVLERLRRLRRLCNAELTVRSSVFPVCPQYAPILFRFQSAILRFLRFPEAFVTERAACKTVLQDATCIQETYRQRQAARLYLTLYLTMNLQDVADAIALQSLDRGLDE